MVRKVITVLPRGSTYGSSNLNEPAVRRPLHRSLAWRSAAAVDDVERVCSRLANAAKYEQRRNVRAAARFARPAGAAVHGNRMPPVAGEPIVRVAAERRGGLDRRAEQSFKSEGVAHAAPRRFHRLEEGARVGELRCSDNEGKEEEMSKTKQ